VPGAVLVLLRDVSEAHEAARLRDDLTHLLLHDLRNPLSNVMLALQLLSPDDGPRHDHGQLRLLNIARDSAEQLLQMTNTLLDISRLEEGQVPLRRQVVNLVALVQQATERVAPLAADRQIRIERVAPPALPVVWLDRDLMLRVIQNLLVNALKYSPRRTVVRVELGVDAATVRIAVHDQGIGIAAQYHDAIFRKYMQMGEHRGGSGLGLYLSKLVVEAHGGTIGVISAAGSGSSFVVALPC
jgi:signal transduction histidine kinase